MPALRFALRLAPLTLTALAGGAFAQAAPVPLGHDQAPGQRFHITPDSLPAPYATPSGNAGPIPVPRGAHEPIVPAGFSVTLFVDGLEGPRRLLVQEDGLVMFAQQALGRVLKLRDTDGDGAADQGGLVVEGTLNPFGLAIVPQGKYKGDLLLADQDAIYRLPLVFRGFQFEQLTPIDSFGAVAGHITRDLAVDPRTGAMYVGVGSMGNLAEEPAVKATIQRFDADGSHQTTFASGMRNTTGMDFNPATGALYAVVMERDGMGDALVPDYLTRVEEGDFFGWPYQYAGGFVQPEFKDHAPKQAAAKLPDVLFEAHSAPLDVAFIPDSWPADWRGDAFVALHGSSNAGAPTGYKVVRVHFRDGVPDGTYDNFMTGFWVANTAPAMVWGRPAALAFAADGALLVADDLGSTIWRVMPQKQ